MTSINCDWHKFHIYINIYRKEGTNVCIYVESCDKVSVKEPVVIEGLIEAHRGLTRPAVIKGLIDARRALEVNAKEPCYHGGLDRSPQGSCEACCNEGLD